MRLLAGLVFLLVCAESGAQVSGTPPMGFIQAQKPPQVSYVTQVASSAAQTTYTFSGVSLGAAASDRLVIVGVVATATAVRLLSSATIAGIPATINVQSPTDAASVAAIVSAVVPTGTTGNIVVTFNGSMVHSAISVYRAVQLRSIVPVSTDHQVDGSGTTATGNVDVVGRGGFAIGQTVYANNSLNRRHSSAMKVFAVSASAVPVTTTTTTASNVDWTGLTESHDSLLASTVLTTTFIRTSIASWR